MKRTTKATASQIPYTPNEWTLGQFAAHRADSLEEAFHAASCLAGGWYRRAVAIDYRVTADNNEDYMLRPSEIAVEDGWRPVYELKSIVID